MLFDLIPKNFFSPLASPGKAAYWECIVRIYTITSQQLSFGVERDILVDDLRFYFESVMAADPAAEGAGEESPNYAAKASNHETKASNHDAKVLDYAAGTTEYAAGASPRDRANFVLRMLENCGWIYTEVDHSYVQRVNFRDYAIRIIQTLLSVSEAEKAEYQGYIYTIYSLVRSKTNPGYALLEINRQTGELITALKNLNANIKNYIDELTKHETVSEILDALLNDYYTNIVDKAYHRLLTSDNVAKFRPEIIAVMEKNSRSRTYLEEAAREIAEKDESSPEEAREKVLSMIHQVVDAFRRMDDILDEINQKNTKYQRAAISRARFMLTSSDDLRGRLKDILSFIGERMQEDNLDASAVYELPELDRLFRIFSWNYLDMDSLYSPTQGRKEFSPQLMKRKPVDPEERARKHLEMEERLSGILNQARIDQYVLKVLGERKSLKASSFPLDQDGFIRLIYIRLYGQRKNMKYRIEMGDMVSTGGYRFRDFVIIRK